MASQSFEQPASGAEPYVAQPTKRVRTHHQSNVMIIVAATLLLIIIVSAIFGPVLSGYDGEAMDFDALEAPPSAAHWFGTDMVGRDLFIRCLMGARVSFLVAIIAITISLAIGVPWGMMAGLASPRIDNLMMRFVDTLYGLPVILLVILLVVVFGRNQFLLFAALGAFFWMDIARIVRGQTLQIRQAPFIEAAKAMGAHRRYIALHHILPNVSGPIIVYATLAIPGIILAESFISFLGLGIAEPDTSWGVLVSDGVQTMETSPWQVFFPGMMLATTIWCCNTLGDRLRDRWLTQDSTKA